MAARPDPLEHGRWWDATLNVVGGCEVVDRSCAFCYAPWRSAGIQTATGNELHINTAVWKAGRWTFNGHLTELPPNHPTWDYPLTWVGSPKPLLGPGKPSLIFLNSMSDLFHPGRPLAAIHRILENVALSKHIGMVLSKHPGPMVAYFRDKPEFWRRRIWLGFSAGDQRGFDLRWELMRPLAEARWLVFVSLQPLLAPVILPPDFLKWARWVIVGGEQHPGNREMDLDWVRALLNQCREVRMPIFIKQATRGRLPPYLLIREFPDVP